MAAGSTYTPIATTTISSASSSYTFSSIPSTYTDLILVTNVIATGDMQINCRVNGDSSALYSTTYLAGNGTSAVSSRQSGATFMGTDYYFSATTNGNVSILHFMNYSNTTTNKTMINRANAADKGVMANVSLWRSTAAINAIQLYATSNNFNVGSTFTLYGIQAA